MSGVSASTCSNVMMEIGREVDYAVRAILELATHAEGVRLSSAEIAERAEIPAPFLTRILLRLASNGIVSTAQVVKGGVILSRAAAEISLLEVVEAIEGPISLDRCQRYPDLCPRDCDSAIYPAWGLVRGQLRNSMDEVKFSTLARVATPNSTAH
jgi:Rrf2 family protein